MPEVKRPRPGEIEIRSAPPDALSTDGPRLRGVIPYGVESREQPGGWREVMDAGCLDHTDLSETVLTVDHAGLPLGRVPNTLETERRADGLHWSCEPPSSRADVTEAVSRGDLGSSSWRMQVKRDRWQGNTRHVVEVAKLFDVSIVTHPAYAEARAELRSHEHEPPPPRREPEQRSGGGNPAGGLRVEDRVQPDAAATAEQRVQRVVRALRATPEGENRSLTVGGADPIEPPELSTALFDLLRPTSIALASGIATHPTSAGSVIWPRITSDVDPQWVAAGQEIPEGTPGIGSLEATPHKLAHRAEVENEVLDDSEPSAEQLLRSHIGLVLALKLDRSVFEGNPGADLDSIRGLKYVSGIQEILLATNGAALANYDPVVRAVGMLRRANVPGPYVAACHPDVLTSLELLKTNNTDSTEQLGAPAGTPPFYTSSQFSAVEAAGTTPATTSMYVYAPAELLVVNRQEAEILLDRSRLFHRDMSEIRAKMRVDFIVPNPVAVVRIRGIIPAV